MIVPYGLAGPFLRLLPPEAAHRMALAALRLGLAGADPAADDPVLGVDLWGRRFANPIGLAAGFDKNAAAVAAVARLGFGFVEIGSVTPRPQPGNPRPRLFRLAADRAIINRFGFNSDGLTAVSARLRAFRARHPAASVVLGGNLAKNRDSDDAAADYAQGVRALAGLVDYLVINVSSPNTPGLRGLQARERLAGLLARVEDARAAAAGAGAGPPLLVKIAPDLSAGERESIAAVALEHAVDGLIVGNSTVARPAGLRGRHRHQAGGLSGRPLFALSTEVLADIYRLTGGRLALVGCGGVASGRDAYAKIRAGASLVQLYTALVYAGPGLVRRIKTELAACLRRDGFASVAAAVGAGPAAGGEGIR